MSPGTSLIIDRSSIDDDLRVVMAEHPHFNIDPRDRDDMSYFIDEPSNRFDEVVLEFLSRQGYDREGMVVEYWFQNHAPPFSSLSPHCDYNLIYREKMKLEGDDWPHRVDKRLITSPITIAAYIQIDNLVGGELGISSRTWMEEQFPVSYSVQIGIKQYPYELFAPSQGDVVYFKGSHHYHWIEPVRGGVRKSVLINFWPKELL